ncbi:MAG: WcaI family glycosyltransferase [Bacteroidota bacterium]
MDNKKIAIIGINYFPEDTAIGLYSTQMALYLSKHGHTIDVITGFPYYPHWKIRKEYKAKPRFLKEKIEDINVFRYKQYVPKQPNFLKRIIHILDFTLGSLINIGKVKEADVIIAVVPFTSTILLAWLLKRRTKAKLWVHVQDFEFDAAFQTGITSKKPSGLKRALFSVLFKIEKWLFSKADRASTISHTMLHKLKGKTKDAIAVDYFPNWIDSKTIDPQISSVHPYMNSNKFKILYSGNIGDKQDWAFFMEFIKELNPEETEVVLVGDGARREWLSKEMDDFEFVKYYPPVAFEELSNLLCSADMHLLFQKEDVLDTVMPSKLLGMMASGKPSLITGNKASEVKKIIEESKGGLYTTKENMDELMNFMKMLVQNRGRASEIGHAARTYVLNKFDQQIILSSFEKRIKDI